MQRTSALVVLTAIPLVTVPVHADAQPQERQIRQNSPLVLRVRPSASYGRKPAYLVGSSYAPRNAFDPIELAPPLGLGANNVAITLPATSASCRVETIEGIRYASPGCLDTSYGEFR